jgi:hypothetical protein
MITLDREICSKEAPTCLPPWMENPYRLVSLWDIVKPFPMYIFTSMLSPVDIDLHARANDDASRYSHIMDSPLRDDTKQLMQMTCKLQREECVSLGLIASVATIDRLLLLASNAQATLGQLDSLEKELKSRLADELRGNFFLSLTASESERYNRWFDGWLEAVTRFPQAFTDIEEMNKCFALGRYAGAVFHSVQTIECGLIEFGTFMKVNDPRSGWTAVTKRLEILVTKTRYQDLDPLHQKHFNFLEQMHGVVGALNNAWRNKISHAQGRLVLMTSEFSSEVAEEIIVVSRSFMRRLATELPPPARDVPR